MPASHRPALIRTSALVAALLLGVGCGDKATEGMNPGECTDGADNDANGAFDCADPGCAGSPDCAGGDTGNNNSDDTGTNSGTGDGTGNGSGDDGGQTGDDGGQTGGDPGGDEGGDPGGDEGGDEGGDPGGDPGGDEGGDPGGDPGGDEGGDPGGDPGGGTGGSGGSSGGSGGTGGGTSGYTGIYTGDVTINVEENGSQVDSCTSSWTSTSTTSCFASGVGGSGACVEVDSSMQINDAVAYCTMTGPYSSYGTITVTFAGSVNSSGNVTGTLDSTSDPVTGNISTGTMFASFTWEDGNADFLGNIQVSR